MNVEILLCKYSNNDNVVFKNLPVLMRTVLNIDKRLRDCLRTKSINSERAIQI